MKWHALSWIEPERFQRLIDRAAGPVDWRDPEAPVGAGRLRPAPEPLAADPARASLAAPTTPRAALARSSALPPAPDEPEPPQSASRPPASRGAPVSMGSLGAPPSDARRGTLPPPALAAFVPPSGSLDHRLAAYLHWASRAAVTSVLFVADEQGLPLALLGADSEQVALYASTMMRLLGQLRSLTGGHQHGRLSVGLDDHQTMYLVDAMTPWGRYAAALITGAPLDRQTLDALQQGLIAAFHDQAQRSHAP